MQENERINIKKNLLPYATMIYLLLLNYGSYGLFLEKHTKQFVFFAPLFCSIIFFAWKILKNKYINRRMTIITLVFVVCVIMSMAINNDFASDTFSMLIVLMTAFFFSQSVLPPTPAPQIYHKRLLLHSSEAKRFLMECCCHVSPRPRPFKQIIHCLRGKRREWGKERKGLL